MAETLEFGIMAATEYPFIWSAPAERSGDLHLACGVAAGWGGGWLQVQGARSARSQSGVALRLPPYQSIPSRGFLRYPDNLCLPGTNFPDEPECGGYRFCTSL